MARRPDVAALAPVHREAEGMANPSGLHLVPADDPRKDGEAGCVRGRPALRPPVVGAQVPSGAVGGRPGPVGVPGGAERARRAISVGAVHDDDVVVGAEVRRRIPRDGIGPGVALRRGSPRKCTGTFGWSFAHLDVGQPVPLGGPSSPPADLPRPSPRCTRPTVGPPPPGRCGCSRRCPAGRCHSGSSRPRAWVGAGPDASVHHGAAAHATVRRGRSRWVAAREAPRPGRAACRSGQGLRHRRRGRGGGSG